MSNFFVPGLGQQRPSPYWTTQPGNGPVVRADPGGGGGINRTWEYQGVEFTIDKMREMVFNALNWEQKGLLRRHSESIIAQVRPKDYLSEVAALYYYCLKQIRYTRDALHSEFAQGPLMMLQPQPWDRAAGRKARQDDCLPEGTLLLMPDGRHVPIQNLEPGARIWGRNKWSVVQRVWGNGTLSVDAVGLDNGRWLKATSDHKVYVMAAGETKRIRISELVKDDLLVSPRDVGVEGTPDKCVRVVDIKRRIGILPVLDIETDDHYVYLPEADVTVSNCEAITTTIAAMCMSIGNPCSFCTITTNRNSGYHHVFCVAKLPRKRVVLDPVAGPEVRSMLGSTVKHAIWDCEPVRYLDGSTPGWGIAGMPSYESYGPPSVDLVFGGSP